MEIVKMVIKSTDSLSKEQIAELHKNKDKPIVFDEDSPEMTPEMLAKFKRVNPREDVTAKRTDS